MATKYMNEQSLLQKIFREGGAKAAKGYIEANVDQWKNAKVSIAVTGGTATGKSTFINKIRGVGPSNKGFAKSGYGDTTREPRKYKHPTNDKIEFTDLPGFGTLKFPMLNYKQKMKMFDYDYVLIFFDKVISENDVAVAQELEKMDTPFCFVRSKVDADLKNSKHDGRQQDITYLLSSIHQSAKQSLAKYGVLKTAAIFVISGRKTDIGELPKLLEHMEKRMPSIKYESIMRSLDSFSTDVIEQKYQILRSSLFWKSLSLAFKATSKVYSVKDLLENEYKEYLKAFNIKIETTSITSDQTISGLLEISEKTNLVDRLHDLAFAGLIGTAFIESAVVLFPPLLFGSIVSYQFKAVKMYVSLGTMLDKAHNLAKEDYKKHVHSKL